MENLAGCPGCFRDLGGWGLVFSEYLSKWVEQRTAKSRAQLEAELMELREENAQLRERVVLAERSSQINQQAAMEVKRNLTALQDELLALRQEVTFYRNIVSPRMPSLACAYKA